MARNHRPTDSMSGTSTVLRFGRRPFVSLLLVLTLAFLAVTFLLVTGEVSPPSPVPRLAIAAVDSQPAPPAAPAQPAEPPLLTLQLGDIPLLQSLQERQARLAAREQQIGQREQELQLLQQQLQERLATLSKIRREIGVLIAERDAFEAKRFAHLVKIYEGMKPAEAAALIERLHSETAVKLFYRMKGRKVSQILEFVKPEVAAKLSERLAEYP